MSGLVDMNFSDRDKKIFAKIDETAVIMALTI